MSQMSDIPDNPSPSSRRKWSVLAIFRNLLKADRNLHQALLERLPRFTSVVDRVFEGLFGFFTHPALAIIAAFILVALGATGVINLIVAVCTVAAALVALLWLSRTKRVRSLSVIVRCLVIIIAALVLRTGGIHFTHWAVNQYKAEQAKQANEQVGKIDIPHPIESPTPLPSPEIAPSPRPHKRPRPGAVSTQTPPAPIVNTSDQATIGVLQAILIANDQQHTVSVPIVLKNFGNLPSQGELHCRVFFEDTVSHEKAESLPADAPQTVAFAPQQQNTYTFRIGENQALYDRFIEGSVTITTELRIAYRPIPTNDKTTVYRLLDRFNFKTREVEIEFSGWE